MDIYLPGPAVTTFGTFPAGINTNVSQTAAAHLALFHGAVAYTPGSNPVVLDAQKAAAVDALVSGAVNLYPESQIKFGTFGDSIANWAGVGATPHDFTSTTASINIPPQKPPLWLSIRTGYRLMFNGGVSGETTRQMLDREAASASSTRKAIADAAALGAQMLWFSAGVNDVIATVDSLPGITASSTPAQIEAKAQNAAANNKALMRRAVAAGIYPIWSDINGYATGTTADIPNKVVCIRRINALMAAAVAAEPALGSYVATASLVTNADGSWITNYDNADQIHPAVLGSLALTAPIAAEMLRVGGLMRINGAAARTQFALPRTSPNIFQNGDLSASSGGLATGVTVNEVGVIVRTNQIVEWRGRLWQEISWTTTNANGTNSTAGVFVVLTLPISGGSPTVPISAGDLIAGEIDVYIDDGAGGPSALFQPLWRVRMDTAFADMPLSDTALPTAYASLPLVFDQKLTSIPVVAPAASAALTTVGMYLGVYNKATASTMRLRFSLPRCVKLPAGY